MIADPVLVLVDMQNDFCKPGFAHDAKEGVDITDSNIQSAIDNAGAFLERYRESGRTPILVQTAHEGHTTPATWQKKYETQNRPVPCRPGTEGAEFVPELDVRGSDVVVTKHRYNAFFETDLNTILRASGISNLLIGGVATHVCVESTVRGAYDRNYDVTTLSDCVGATDPEQHERVLQNVARHFGSVASSDEITLAPIGARAEST